MRSSIDRELRNKGSVEWRKLIEKGKIKKVWGKSTSAVERGKNENKKKEKFHEEELLGMMSEEKNKEKWRRKKGKNEQKKKKQQRNKKKYGKNKKW